MEPEHFTGINQGSATETRARAGEIGTPNVLLLAVARWAKGTFAHLGRPCQLSNTCEPAAGIMSWNAFNHGALALSVNDTLNVNFSRNVKMRKQIAAVALGSALALSFAAGAFAQGAGGVTPGTGGAYSPKTIPSGDKTTPGGSSGMSSGAGSGMQGSGGAAATPATPSGSGSSSGSAQ